MRAGLDLAFKIQNRLDIIVPTVGGGGFKPLLMLDAATFEAELKVNIISAFLAVRYGVPLMEGGGSVVCISSTAATLPFAYLPAYHTAKGGLENFVRAASEELGSAGVRVNAVRPGLTRSDATGPMFAAPASRKTSPRPCAIWPGRNPRGSRDRASQSMAATKSARTRTYRTWSA